MSEQPGILAEIIEHKTRELVERKQRVPEETLREWVQEASAPRGFESALA